MGTSALKASGSRPRRRALRPRFISGKMSRPLTFGFRLLTSRLRVNPDFLIIGAQKAGTTSVFRYLEQHPNVLGPAWKEVHFFNAQFDKGMQRYRAHFPLPITGVLDPRAGIGKKLTFDATPDYIFHPLVPQRVAGALPGVKLIALLRNPVDRAYSAYQHNVRYGREPLSFEETIDSELQSIDGDIETLFEEGRHYIDRYVRPYVLRGAYAYQLKNWLSHFPPEQLLALSSEEFFADTPNQLKRIIEFLGLPEWEPKAFEVYNQGVYGTDMDSSTRKRLADFFRPHNERLYQLLKTRFDWDGVAERPESISGASNVRRP